MICWLSCEGAVVAGGVGSGGEERGERSPHWDLDKI